MKNFFVLLSVFCGMVWSVSAVADADRVIRRAERIAQRVRNRASSLNDNQIERINRNFDRISNILRGGGGGGGGGGRRAIRISNGYLEVRVQNEWRGVCDDSFDSNDGQVACRQLGGTYVSWTTVNGPSNFWLDDLACNGSESMLTQCGHRGLGSHNCGSGENVMVTCSGLPTRPGRRTARLNELGLLEVRHQGEWRGVCDDSFDSNDAQVACREMGFSSVSTFSTSRSGPNSNFWLDDLNCSGNESSLKSCSHNGLGSHNCGSGEWIALSCSN